MTRKWNPVLQAALTAAVEVLAPPKAAPAPKAKAAPKRKAKRARK